MTRNYQHETKKCSLPNCSEPAVAYEGRYLCSRHLAELRAIEQKNKLKEE